MNLFVVVLKDIENVMPFTVYKLSEAYSDDLVQGCETWNELSPYFFEGSTLRSLICFASSL